ncbi:DNA-binding SARP family transcriptional activator [Kitasatospora sp. MAA4]|uniref:BTAD domain-containing putative transcriptional regulator n=1 Tax=Kitasatospora sp. MAA4 TaxID=3035093 RepID=UPI0024734288|nr:BTAD domain-containing putative transcriptional regulator [Kitasatospora sp. MAA4]MDH6137751.1 DNA-binding SARP family transcriptional activator [Kitasatospora sp. MAA4]
MALVERALAAATERQTGALLVEGEAGIGRTSFLIEASALARRLGFTVARGRCHPQEQSHPLGVARQVFASLLVADPDFTGLPDIDPGRPGSGPSAAGLFEVMVTLYRLLAQAAARSPLMLVIDDLQWCDESSLRALSQLVHHGVRLRLVVVAAVRSGEPVPHTAAFQDATGHLRRTRLAGLDPGATRCLVRAVLPGEPDPEFVLACRQATGGNPTLLRALLDELARQEAVPDAACARELLGHAPEPTARDAEQRIQRLGPAATALVQAVAVLGDGTDLGRAAAVAGLPPAEAASAADLLIRGGVLANRDLLTFRHAVVGAAIARHLPAGTAGTLRLRAAAQLRRAGTERESAPVAVARVPEQEAWQEGREVGRRSAWQPSEAGRAAEAPGQLEIRCFGRFRIVRDNRELDLSPVRPKVRTLLRLLALQAGAGVHRDHLLDALWPEFPPEQGIRNLQVTVSRLRTFLEPGSARGASRFLLRSGASYRLVLEPDVRCDVREFERAIGQWRRNRAQLAPTEEAELLAAALDWYAGDLLPEDGAAEWVVTERARLRGKAAEVHQALAEVCLGLGRFGSAARAARQSLLLDPFRDAAWRVLAATYHSAGDPAAAEQTRREYARMLRSLGTGPGAVAGARVQVQVQGRSKNSTSPTAASAEGCIP